MQNCMGKPLETGDVLRLALTTTHRGPCVRPLRADPSLVFLARACSPEADNKGHKVCHVMEQEVG